MTTKDYEFTKDWFSANHADWKRVLTMHPKRYLEIGSFEGRSVCTLIEAVRTLEHCVCIDSWVADPTSVNDEEDMEVVEKRFDHNVQVALERRAAAHSEWPVPLMFKQRSRSFDALVRMNNGFNLAETKFDLVYIDGSHRPEHCLEDMILSFRLLRQNGVMIVDDYLWADEGSIEFPRTPKLAVDAFTTIFWPHLRIAARQSLYQVYIIKIGDVT